MYNRQHLAAIIVAGGTSSRMGFDKLLHQINGVEIVRLSVLAMDAHPYVDSLVIVASALNIQDVRRIFALHPPEKQLQIVQGGATRAASVANGLAACPPNTSLVAIHDAARPFVSAALISRTVHAAAQTGAAAPGVPVTDTVKQIDGSEIVLATPARHTLRAVQTPQVFDYTAYFTALAAISAEDYPAITDDCLVMERSGHPVQLVEGEAANRKITTPQDLPEGSAPAMSFPRIGHGYDVHRLTMGRPLILGGVNIPCEKGLQGHSDADVLAHAVCDALLGAAALGDIGAHFPDTSEVYKNADSLVLLGRVAGLVRQSGYTPCNIDATLLCELPKLAPHIAAMRCNLARVLNMPEGMVSVKATTEEGLGFTGAGEGIAAHCIALVANNAAFE